MGGKGSLFLSVRPKTVKHVRPVPHLKALKGYWIDFVSKGFAFELLLKEGPKQGSRCSLIAYRYISIITFTKNIISTSMVTYRICNVHKTTAFHWPSFIEFRTSFWPRFVILCTRVKYALFKHELKRFTWWSIENAVVHWTRSEVHLSIITDRNEGPIRYAVKQEHEIFLRK